MPLSLQQTYAPLSRCFGCGPANDKGLRVRSVANPNDPSVVCDFTPEPHHAAFDNVVNGGILGTVLDCHMNWTAVFFLMKQRGESHAPSCVTAEFRVKLRKPTPMLPFRVEARVVASSPSNDRAEIEATVLAPGGVVTATGSGTFVAVPPGHPAYHRW